MENNIHITDTGIVSGIISGKHFPRIYSFVHNTSLSCNHFDNEQLIERKSELSFLKDYYYLGDVVHLHHDIQMLPNGIVWKISRLEPFNPIVRFGITIPANSFETEDGRVDNIVNYSQYWRYAYPGQSNIDVPIIHCDNINVSVPLDQNVQFMFFEDSFLKIATLDENDTTLYIYFTPVLKDFRDDYISIHPNAENFVFIWKTLFEKIKTKYGITIHYGKTTQMRHFFPHQITNTGLSRFASILEQSLDIYPRSFLKSIPLSYISICSDMSNSDCVLKGIQDRNNILLNTDLSDTELKITIHHELFHFVSPNEKFAQLFANFIVSPSSINKTSYEWRQLKKMFEDFLDGQAKDEFLYFLNHHSTKHNVEIIKSTYELSTAPQKANNVFGTSVLDCFSIIQKSIPEIREIKAFSSLSRDDTLICFTVNPIDYCELNMTDPQESLQNWINFHVKCCSHKNLYFLNIEYVYRKQWAFLNRFFKGLGIEIDVQKIQELDVYSRTKKYSNPSLKELWESVRKHPIFKRTGYNNISVNE